MISLIFQRSKHYGARNSTISDAAPRGTCQDPAGIGFNCYSFEAATSDGPLELLWTAPDFLTGTGRPSGSGIPLLFPFAGRLRGTSFRFQGRTYHLKQATDRATPFTGSC